MTASLGTSTTTAPRRASSTDNFATSTSTATIGPFTVSGSRSPLTAPVEAPNATATEETTSAARA